MDTDVLAIRFPTMRDAGAACIRLTEAMTTGLLAVRAAAVIEPARKATYRVHDGFEHALRPTETPRWLAAYAATVVPYGARPPQHMSTPRPKLPGRIDPGRAATMCQGLKRPHVALVIELADSTPLLALEIIRPRNPGVATLLGSWGNTERAELNAVLTAHLTEDHQHPH